MSGKSNTDVCVGHGKASLDLQPFDSAKGFVLVGWSTEGVHTQDVPTTAESVKQNKERREMSDEPYCTWFIPGFHVSLSACHSELRNRRRSTTHRRVRNSSPFSAADPLRDSRPSPGEGVITLQRPSILAYETLRVVLCSTIGVPSVGTAVFSSFLSSVVPPSLALLCAAALI